MKRLEWEARKWTDYFGVQGLVGLGLVVLALLVFLGGVLPAEAKLLRTTNTAADLQSRHDMALANPAAYALPVESDLTSFYKSLPSERNATQQMRKIYQIADKQSLRLSQGEYKFTREKDAHLGSYQITLPVKGSYIQIKKFIAKAMNAMPTLALDGVTFKRETIRGTEVEAKIQFTLFLGIA